MESYQTWARSELAHADLGQAARTKRAVTMLATMAAQPAGTVPAVFAPGGPQQGAYGWLENRAVRWEDVAAAQHVACARRCRDHALVIVPVDGTSVAHTDLRGDDGVGPIGTRAAGALGIKAMTAIALTYDGVPLGVAAHTFWARPKEPLTVPREKRSLEERESRHWTELQHDFDRTLAAEGANTRPWYQLDREGDSTHVLMRTLESPALVTVRANHDRLLTPGAKGTDRKSLRKLREALGAAPPRGVTYLEVLRHRHRTERVARLEVRFARVSLRLRKRWSHEFLGDVEVFAVRVCEVGTTPAGEEPIDWLLLTTFPVLGLEDALRVVRAYSLRWVIERVNYTWKSGACRVEDSQLESFESLAKWATLHLSVATREQSILRLSRTQPELPATEVFVREQVDAALALHHTNHPHGPALGSTPTLGDLVRIIARLGGFAGSSRHNPGIKVFVRGMQKVEVAAEVLSAYRAMIAVPTSRDPSG
jgi:hypothetical protein